MNRLGLLLALAGLGAALLLLAQQGVGEVWALLASAGFGLVLAALAHVPAMALNAHAWRVLIARPARPGLGTMTANVWIRESVNGLLPVARIGGELASYRLLRAERVAVAPAASSLLVDMAIGVLSQLLFSILGLALLALAGGGVGWGGIAAALIAGLALGAGFILAQRADPFTRVAALLNRVAAGRMPGFLAHSRLIDRHTRRLWRARRAIGLCFGFQLAGWAAGAAEIWLALYFLGAPVSVGEALAIEAMIQAISSAGFLVPGALGLQEAGFLGLGALLGLPAEASAALAVARRLRDLVIFLPGLAAWVWLERQLK